MLRETTFVIGGVLLVLLGGLVGYGLYSAGAGVEYSSAWLAVPLAGTLGGFFVYVGRAERRERRAFLRTVEEAPAPAPPGR